MFYMLCWRHSGLFRYNGRRNFIRCLKENELILNQEKAQSVCWIRKRQNSLPSYQNTKWRITEEINPYVGEKTVVVTKTIKHVVNMYICIILRLINVASELRRPNGITYKLTSPQRISENVDLQLESTYSNIFQYLSTF